jgi:Skp family chaperone for outer membrane proteins
MPDAKPDNSTHAEIKSLSDKFDRVHQRIDESSTKLEQEIDKRFDEAKNERDADKKQVASTLQATEERHERAVDRTIKRAGIYATIAIFLLGAYLHSVRGKLDDVTTAVNSLVETTNSQATKIEVIGERLNYQNELRTLFQKMDTEVQSLKLEIERLKKP